MTVRQKRLLNQKKIIQQKLDLFAALDEPPPLSGWLKAVRGSLGLTTRQLAKRVGINHSSIDQIEKREPKGKVTLESLKQVAQAMDCKLVYAIVPINSKEKLDDIIYRKAKEVAEAIVSQASLSMKLEAQGITKKQSKEEVLRVTEELIASGDPRIWDTPLKKMKK